MRHIQMNDALVDYVAASANPAHDPVAAELAATTRDRFGDLAGMNIGVDQGAFLEMLVAITGARTVVEIGTFTGMSALWLARGLDDDGRLICCDVSDEYLPTAREAWEAAGVADRVDFRLGPAADTVAAMPEEPHIDVAFVDADKPGYRTYLDLLLPRMTDRGVIAVDNVLWSGRIVDEPGTDNPATDDNTLALRDFNAHVARRDDVHAVMLTIGDGVTLIRPANRG